MSKANAFCRRPRLLSAAARRRYVKAPEGASYLRPAFDLLVEEWERLVGLHSRAAVEAEAMFASDPVELFADQCAREFLAPPSSLRDPGGLPLPLQLAAADKELPRMRDHGTVSCPSRRPALFLLRGSDDSISDPDFLRPFVDADGSVVLRDLLPVLDPIYPGFDVWLDSRLQDVLAGVARCNLARDLHGLRAIAIETPKGPGCLKLSTIWVADRARGNGLGSRLLSDCRNRWVQAGLDRVWVTVSPFAYLPVSRLLVTNGFRQTAVDPDRYGKGRPEAVFTWRPEQDPDAAHYIACAA